MLELCFAATMHFGIGQGWQDMHPCARYVGDYLTVGAYLNSENTLSTYVSHEFKYDKFGLELGAVTGYSGAVVAPMAMVRYEIGDGVDLIAMPAYGGPEQNFGLVLGVEISTGFGG